MVRVERRRDRELPEDAWLLGRGYNEQLLAERRQPTRWDLDLAAPNRPVALTRTCGHMIVGNSRALALAGVGRTTADPPGGEVDRDSSGEPTGLVKENAMGLLTVIPEHPWNTRRSSSPPETRSARRESRARAKRGRPRLSSRPIASSTARGSSRTGFT
jgi:predicted amidohydrolase YtcJ